MADLDTTSNLYSGKLTWNIGQGQTLIGTVFGDPTNDNGAVGPAHSGRRRPTTGRSSVGGTDFGARYQGILGPKWLVTGQFVYHRENVNTLPGPEATRSRTSTTRTGTAIAPAASAGPQGTASSP